VFSPLCLSPVYLLYMGLVLTFRTLKLIIRHIENCQRCAHSSFSLPAHGPRTALILRCAHPEQSLFPPLCTSRTVSLPTVVDPGRALFSPLWTQGELYSHRCAHRERGYLPTVVHTGREATYPPLYTRVGEVNSEV